MGKNNLKARKSWHLVTNSYIADNFAQPSCRNCLGKGFLESLDSKAICGCAVLTFRRRGDEMVREGKLRVNSDGKFEYRTIGVI